jgi:hypothetical protein
VRLFGPPWNAPVDQSATRVPTPVGEPCGQCGRPIHEGDQGAVLPAIAADGTTTRLPVHRACLLDAVGVPPS